MISCKIALQLKVTVSKENMNLYLPLSFYCCFLFVTEAAFISEQFTECRFGALLEISDKFSSKLNIFSCMIWQCWFNLESFAAILYDFEKHRG